MNLRARTWLKRIGIALAVALAVLVAFVYWLLATEAGARFAIERAKTTLAGKLLLAEARGALISPLELHDVHYRDAASGVDVKIKSLKVEYDFLGILRRSLKLRNVQLDGVDIALTTVPPASATAPMPSLKMLLTPPLDILIERLHIGKTAISKDGKPMFASDSLDAAATWTGSALTVKQLALRAPDGRIDLNGALTTYTDLRGSAKLAIDWKIPHASGPDRGGPDRTAAATQVAGTLDFHNDGKQANFTLALSQPLAAAASGTLAPNDKALPWTLNLDLPTFDPARLTKSDALKSLTLHVSGAGDRNGGTLRGNVDANAHRVLIDPLTFAVAGKTLTLETLHLHSPEAAGALTAQARVQLDTKPIGGDLKLTWEGVELPADLVGQAIASHGTLNADGNADKFAAQGEFSVGPPNQLADIAFKLDGTPDKIELQQLDLRQPKGGLNASGAIALKPQIGWNLNAKADRFNPGAFAKDWPGAVNFTLSTSGNVEKDGTAGKLKLDNLSGTLRQRTLGGNADLAFALPFNVDGKLSLSSGKSSVTLIGKGGAGSGARTDIRIDLAIDSLGDWVPNSGGSLRGDIAVQGAWPKLDASGKLAGVQIASGNTHVQALTLGFDVHDLSAPSGTLDAEAKTLAAGSYVFETLKLDAKGNQAAHHLELDARGKPLSMSLALDGGLVADKGKSSDWRGTLDALTLDVKDQPHWKLAHPAALAYVDGAFNLDELCLRAGAPGLCASASQDAKNGAQAKFTIEHLPLSMIAKLASPDAPLKLDGEINGNGSIVQSLDGALTGQTTIRSESGSITYPDSAAQAVLAYRNFHIDAALSPQQSTITIAGDLNDGGRLDGHIVSGAVHDDSAGGAMPLSGNLSATINNLSFVDLLTPSVSGTRGKVAAKFALSGTTAKPGVEGELALTDFATEVPAAGLKLHDGKISVLSRDGENFAIDGSIASDEGTLTLKGTAGIAANAPVALTLKGEDFLAANIPGAKVHISPDLKIDRDGKRLAVGGTLGIPRMFVDLAKLPGGGAAVATSPDVVVVDEPPAPAAAALPVEVDITLNLGMGEKLAMDLRQGTEVHLIGFGLNADLGGQLSIVQAPGRPPIGRGQIQLNGTFKAYGQDMTIQEGRLLFAGTPVENPGLDIRATRAFPDQSITVGLRVRGTALTPQLTVFSDPAMEQSDALSYLVAGKPLSQLKGGEGNAVGSAASALGTAGGDMLAKSIGAKMGLDDVGVADNSSVGGAALTVGKYLSPRLYLSYGVGLFAPGQVVTLRYKLTRLFDLEMRNGTLSSRAGINYRIEK